MPLCSAAYLMGQKLSVVRTSVLVMTNLVDLSDEQVADEITTWAGRVAAGEARLLTLIGEFDRREAWSGAGLLSCAHWLSWRLGMGLTAAHERVRVARAPQGLPLLIKAFGAGQLSWTQVRAVTRVATGADEASWVELARSGTGAQLESLVRGCAGHCASRKTRPIRSRRRGVTRRGSLLAVETLAVGVRPVTSGDLTRHELGRTQRLSSLVLRGMLATVDGERCRFPGCARHRKLHAHHVQFWSLNGPTDLANLLLLCPRHHTLVHAQGFQLLLHPDRSLTVRTAQGVPVLHHPVLPWRPAAARQQPA